MLAMARSKKLIDANVDPAAPPPLPGGRRTVRCAPMPEDGGAGGGRWIVVFLVAAVVVTVVFAVTGSFDSGVPAVLGVVLWSSVATALYGMGRRAEPRQKPIRARPKTGLDRWGPVICVGLLIAFVIWDVVIPTIRSRGPDGSVLSWTVPFDETGLGSDIDVALAGGLDVTESLQLVAWCRNGTDWVTDRTLNTWIVVATKPALVRAAELVTDGSFDGGLARRVEQRAMAGQTDDEIVAALGGDWGAEEVERYLTARVEPPSAPATARFVAYAAAVDAFGNGLLRVVDREALDAGAIGSFANRFVEADVRLAGFDGELPVRAGQCDGVADRSD